MAALRHPFVVPHIQSWVHHGHTVNIVYGYCSQGDLGTLLARQRVRRALGRRARRCAAPDPLFLAPTCPPPARCCCAAPCSLPPSRPTRRQPAAAPPPSAPPTAPPHTRRTGRCRSARSSCGWRSCCWRWTTSTGRRRARAPGEVLAFGGRGLGRCFHSFCCGRWPPPPFFFRGATTAKR